MFDTTLSLTLLILVAVAVNSMTINGRSMTIDQALMQANDGMNEMSYSGAIMPDGTRRRLEEIDIMVTMANNNRIMAESDSNGRVKRKALRDLRTRWPSGRVSYEITSSFSSSERANIMSAIADYHEYTCLTFVQNSHASDRIRFIKASGCWSYVGKQGGVQDLSLGLGTGCNHKGIIIHELGHAIGLYHEQSRPDRDSYVSIQTENVLSQYRRNFDKYSSTHINTYDVNYDYSSVMHYGQYAFSENRRPTIIARDSRFQEVMGNREGFSFLDLKIINLMYDCAEVNGCSAQTCSSWWKFQGPDCQCWCCSRNYLTLVGEPFSRC